METNAAQTDQTFSSSAGAGMVRLSHLFADAAGAQAAVRRLDALGVPHSSVSLVYRKDRVDAAYSLETDTATKDGLEGGAVAGSIVGAIFGAVAATVATIALPGLGILIAGPLAGAVFGAGAGGAAGGLLGTLIGAGVPEENAVAYETGIDQGGVVAIVDVPENMAPAARAALDNQLG